MKTDLNRRRHGATGSGPPPSTSRLSKDELESTIDRLTGDDVINVKEASQSDDQSQRIDRVSSLSDPGQVNNFQAVLSEEVEGAENELSEE